MRKLNLSIIVLAVVILFVGCGIKKDAKDLSAAKIHEGKFEPESSKQVSTTLIKELNLENMIELDIEDISVHYGFNSDYLDDFSAFASKTEGCADEIAVFKILDSKERQVIIDALMEKVKLKSESFKNLNAKEYNKIDANSVSLHGDYIIVIICASPQTAFNIINDFYL